ncbi:MAG: carboxypeptidase M32 [Pseudomonadota bacterium]
MTAAYDALIAHTRQTTALEQAAGLLAWDQETMMPDAGLAQRGEQAAALQLAIHDRATDPRIGDWLAACDGADLPPMALRNVALIRRGFDRATRVPADLQAAIARAASHGHGVWIAARAAKRFADFAPTLDTMLALKREEAACMADPGQRPYDALLEAFEPGLTSAALKPLFESLAGPLSALVQAIAERPAPPPLSGRFPADAQRRLVADVAAALGYRLDAGRIDIAVHPFCSGQGSDVRITTRIDETTPLDCLYSVIHEVGHAIYEQNMPDVTLLEPAGRYASMGLHESQSRLYENQIGRSRAFAGWLYPRLQAAFGALPVDGPEALYAALNRVEPGFIRTEADEVQYNLHILLRWELEERMIDGSLPAADVEEAWNARFAALFGRAVPDAAMGALQDTHWSQGLFGYFPTYTLGNVYAAELFAALERAIPDAADLIAAGDFAPLRTWLTTHVHARANSRPAQQIVADAIGYAPSAAPLIAYLQAKFSGLYALA